MRKYIGCGIYSKFYLILFISIVFQILNEAIYKFNYYENIFDEVKIFHNRGHEYFSKHILIHLIFSYTGLFIFSIPFYIYYNKLEKNILDSSSSFERRKPLLKQYFFILLIVFLWIVEEYLFIFYNFILGGLDSWFLELLIVCYLAREKLHISFYKHHKLSLAINLLPFILKCISIILSTKLEKETSNLIYIKHIWMIPLGILIYIMLALIRSFVNLKIYKISNILFFPNKLLMIYGLIGAIITSIFCIFTSIFNCNDGEIQNYFCNVSKNNITDKYIDSFSIYHNTFQEYSNNDKTQITIEILVIIFGGITFFINKFLSLKIISTDIVLYVYTFPILFLFKKIILIINTLFISKRFFIKDILGINKLKFFLDLIGDIFYFISFLIFSEIIILHCRTFYNNTHICRCRERVARYDEDKVRIHENDILEDDLYEDINILK